MQQEHTINQPNLISLEERRRAALRHTQSVTLLPAGAAFQLQILDDSLTGASIRCFDLIDCERVEKLQASDSPYAVVQTPYGLMVRRYYAEEGYVRLESANHAYPTLCLAPEDVQIIGRLIRLERWYTTFTESEVA